MPYNQLQNIGKYILALGANHFFFHCLTVGILIVFLFFIWETLIKKTFSKGYALFLREEKERTANKNLALHKTFLEEQSLINEEEIVSATVKKMHSWLNLIEKIYIQKTESYNLLLAQNEEKEAIILQKTIEKKHDTATMLTLLEAVETQLIKKYQNEGNQSFSAFIKKINTQETEGAK